MEEKKKYIWYLGYGSNLNKQRFYCYILGGKPEYGSIEAKGCSDRTLSHDDRPYEIKNKLYFGLPEGATGTGNWGPGGVAFITLEESINDNEWTLCRLWKITEDQYEEVRDQEGRNWYNREIILGELDGIPIKTITHEPELIRKIPPSEPYKMTIIKGLKETFGSTSEQACEYISGRERG